MAGEPTTDSGAVIVRRRWPGGPPRGARIEVTPERRRVLLRAGMVDDVPKKPPRRRGSTRRPEQRESDLLAERSTR